MKKNYSVFIAMGLLSFFSCDNLEHNTDKENNNTTETKQLSAESEPKKEMKDVSLTTMEVGIVLIISMGFLLLISQIG